MARSLEANRRRQAKHRAKYRHDPVFQARVRAHAIRWAKENPERRRANELRRHHGITLEQFNAMLDAQAGCCKICTAPMRPGRETCVDHDHITGRIRGFLCRSCNTRLGRLENDMLVAHASMAYAEAC